MRAVTVTGPRSRAAVLVRQGLFHYLPRLMSLLKPISIGPVRIEAPVILAPMTAVTDLPFRRIVKRYGAGLTVTEMIASQAMVRETRQSLQKAMWDPAEEPVSMQLAGCDPHVMAEAARLNEQRGAAIIDINMGCPVKKVVNGEAGSALMRDLPLAARLIEATVKAVKVPVTLKTRMGWNHENLNADALAQLDGPADRGVEQPRQLHRIGNDEEGGERDDGRAGEGALDLDRPNDARHQQECGSGKRDDVRPHLVPDERRHDRRQHEQGQDLARRHVLPMAAGRPNAQGGPWPQGSRLGGPVLSSGACGQEGWFGRLQLRLPLRRASLSSPAAVSLPETRPSKRTRRSRSSRCRPCPSPRLRWTGPRSFWRLHEQRAQRRLGRATIGSSGTWTARGSRSVFASAAIRALGRKRTGAVSA